MYENRKIQAFRPFFKQNKLQIIHIVNTYLPTLFQKRLEKQKHLQTLMRNPPVCTYTYAVSPE